MTHAVVDALGQLKNDLLEAQTDITAQLTSFPTGSAMLDIQRDGRAFVMAYAPSHGFGVDELDGDEGLTAGYRFTFGDFESAAHKLRSLALDPSPPSLSLLVLQCGDIEAARRYYGLLGLKFVEEQHGEGPRHYAANLGSMVLEIYPCQGKPNAPSRLGFRVAELDTVLSMLRRQGQPILREGKDSPWGRRALVQDPDGNKIELTDANGR